MGVKFESSSIYGFLSWKNPDIHREERRVQWHSMFTPAGFNSFKIKPTYTYTTHLPTPGSVIILKEKCNISSAFQHVTLNDIPILLLVSH